MSSGAGRTRPRSSSPFKRSWDWGSAQRLIDGPGITDDPAEGVGAMFRELREAAWDSQVKAELDVDRTKRLAPASASSSLNG